MEDVEDKEAPQGLGWTPGGETVMESLLDKDLPLLPSDPTPEEPPLPPPAAGEPEPSLEEDGDPLLC